MSQSWKGSPAGQARSGSHCTSGRPGRAGRSVGRTPVVSRLSVQTEDVLGETLTGKVALVTGGTRGIGVAITRRLLAAGAAVTMCGRTVPERVIGSDAGIAEFIPCDVRNPVATAGLVDAIVQAHGRLDIVVNNAGGSPQADAATASPRFSERILQLNLLAPLQVAQAAYPHLKESGGSIVNIASVSAVRPSPGTAIYGAAKAGLLSLTTSLAQEWGPEVRVNAVIVGLVETEDAEATYGSAAAQARIAQSLPLRRLGVGADVAEAVAYLASSAARYVSGARLEVHGGGERPHFLEILKHEAGISR